MPQEYKLYCQHHGIKYVEHEDFNEDVIAGADILYMTRVQKERFSDLMDALVDQAINRTRLKAKMIFSFETNLLEGYGSKGSKGVKR